MVDFRSDKTVSRLSCSLEDNSEIVRSYTLSLKGAQDATAVSASHLVSAFSTRTLAVGCQDILLAIRRSWRRGYYGEICLDLDVIGENKSD